MYSPSTSRIRCALLAASIVTVGACTADSGDTAAADSAASAVGAGMTGSAAGAGMRSDSAGGMAGMNRDSSGAMNHAGMGNMTGDPDRDFLQALRLIDQALLTMKDPQVRTMAERMKRDQTREMSEFQQKASKN